MRGIRLDGLSQRINYPGAVPLSASYVSVECWIKQGTFANWSHYLNNGWVGNGWLLYSSATSFIFGVGQGGIQVSSAGWTPSGGITLAGLHHLVGVYDGSNAKLYVDGVLRATGASAPGATLTTGGVMDSGSGGATDPFDIFEPRLYNRPLSATEVAEHYRGVFKDETGLVGLWRLDEGQGTSGADSSGFGNAVSFSASPAWIIGRDITAALDAFSEAEHIPLLAFVEMQFASGTVRVCNAFESVPWNGFTWLGLGNLGTVEPIEENTDLGMSGIGLQLSGVNPALIATALGEQYQGRRCNIWLAFLNPGSYEISADPIGPFRFRMDTMSIDKGKTATITLTAENRLADWDRARIRRWTAEDQRADHPTDAFFDYIPELIEKEIIF